LPLPGRKALFKWILCGTFFFFFLLITGNQFVIFEPESMDVLDVGLSEGRLQSALGLVRKGNSTPEVALVTIESPWQARGEVIIIDEIVGRRSIGPYVEDALGLDIAQEMIP
jgi:hypothetical protein